MLDERVTYDGMVLASANARDALALCDWESLATWATLLASYARCFRAQERVRQALGEQEQFQCRLPGVN